MVKTSLKAAVIGTPIAHSLSPRLFAYWCQQAGIEGEYKAIETADNDEAFTSAIREAMAAGYRGVNITLPHKTRALQIANETTPRARVIGAANMLRLWRDRITADNSDGEGFLRALKHHAPEFSGGAALVLGAGGAAPAIIWALREAGCNYIYIANRTRAHAEKLAERLGSSVEAVSWEEREKLVPYADIIINTTSLGLNEQDDLPVSLETAREETIIADVIYEPSLTPFLAQAKAHKQKYFNGLAMLVYQAMPGFQQWFGAKPGTAEDAMDFLQGKSTAETKQIVLGLTGSIGMGKTATAKLFADYGIPVWDADSAVHRLYDKGGKAVRVIGARFPECVNDEGVDRQCLSQKLSENASLLLWLEQEIHPLVYEDQQEFMAAHKEAAAVLLDIPLLFESKNKRALDAIIVCTAPENVRRERVLKREGMSAAKLETILGRQLGEEERLAGADYVVRTDRGIEDAAQQVKIIMQDLAGKFPHIASLDWPQPSK
jgi:shikimate dehydrogenase